MEGAIHTTKPQKPTTIEQDPNKFYYHFLYKTAIVLIFFVILPLFPSQAPDFINQNLLTRNWELLHLLFVGIAISYGLFSRRNQNDETEKENNNSKFDTAQSLVSRFLQVSSFFEDETENNPHSEETKIQTWNNQHYRNKPVVVVAPHHSDFEDNKSVADKPLLLPVRSLKSRLSDDDDDDEDSKVDKSCTRSFSFDSSRSSKRFSSNSNKARNEEVEEMKENVVLASPIPWRSRSARMEHKLEGDDNNINNTSVHDQQALRSSMEESMKFQFQSQSYSSSSTKKMTGPPPPPPPPPPPQPMVSKESVGKNAEDLLKKKRFNKFSPPPPPPPPPRVSKESLGKNAEDSLKKKSFYKFSPPPPPPPPPTMFQKSMKPPRYGYSEKISMAKHDKPIASFSREIGKKEGKNDEEEHASVVPLVSEEEKESFIYTESEDEDDDVGEGRISVHNSENGEGSKTDNEASSSSLGTVVSDEGPDVDKKADEFIAKFREQIRLQRIQSIKNSTTRIARNSSR